MTAPTPIPDYVFENPVTARMAHFLEGIGIPVRAARLTDQTTLPGVTVCKGTIFVDEHRLAHPGDVLHEAGHLAVVPKETRMALEVEVGTDPALEMAAIAWSWAALVHLDLDPTVVFHDEGYHGGSASIIHSFQTATGFGVPMLAWFGMTAEVHRDGQGGIPAFPQMRQWLRD